MKNLFLLLLFTWGTVTLSLSQVNPNNHIVRGHYRNGTYIAPYHRTNPNNTINDNYSTKPNINPWTGKPGSIEPEYYDRSPLPSAPSHNLNSLESHDWKFSTVQYDEMSTPEGRYWHQKKLEEESRRLVREIEEKSARELKEIQDRSDARFSGKSVTNNSQYNLSNLNVIPKDPSAGKLQDINYSSPKTSNFHHPHTSSENESMMWGLGFLTLFLTIYMLFKER